MKPLNTAIVFKGFFNGKSRFYKNDLVHKTLEEESIVLEIRKAKMEDLDFIMGIYSRAREFMAQTGNPNQWGNSKPDREWIEHDIEVGKCHVCVAQSAIIAVFYFAIEEDPTYKVIYDGQWLSDSPYGVVHRIASAGIVKGAGEFCLKWAVSQCGNLRIDTHHDNVVMQRLLKKLGFHYCGIIYLENGDPRLAFQYEKNGAGVK